MCVYFFQGYFERGFFFYYFHYYHYILPFFHSRGHKTNAKALFWMLTLGHICCSFEFVLVSISLIQGWRVKGMLSMKVLVLCPPEFELCGLQKAKKNPKT